MNSVLYCARQIIVLLAVTLCGSADHVQAKMPGLIPPPPKIKVKSFILMDVDSGEILASDNPSETMHPASITKMMTAYIAEAELSSGNIHRDDQVLISEKAWSMGGSTMFIEVGNRVSVAELMSGIIIVSGNDSSVAIAEHIAGSEDAFAHLMNTTAQRLGMHNTHFKNAAGWPTDNHYSTAHDLAILSKHIIQDYPEYYPLYSEKYYQYGVDKKTGGALARQANRNSLLWTNPYVDGLKTGHIDETGYHLAVTAKRDERRLVAVLLGANSKKQRSEEAQQLLTYGFRFFENINIKKAGEALKTVTVWKGKVKQVTVGIGNDLIVTVPRGTGKRLKASMEVEANLVAPLAKGQQVGVVKVLLEDELIQEVPLLMQQSVEQGGLFRRLWDTIMMFFNSLFL
ncbi:MAG: D-alanyl-D-alanine carboxypeptidase family protein [Candidatus Endonucleobacter bathymodioli]|uniref:serine-type D-Ala-D-Ala carboxypeptidase n=1 Tax=Candidatus Endonucleibacter bathymodioli TaxID=539814 RepID=A0AA90SM96_9GAMM|nr:D-alanyl-D-alanine carboxypeptidase family protein [Candidatus Endonucleobacter bathymodioli]